MLGLHSDFLTWVPPWLTCVLLLATLLLTAAVGRRVGLATPHQDLSAESFDLSIVEGALYGLLGLLIAFTYSFVMVRDDHRKAAVIEEANAIGTAYLRADLAPEPARSELRDLLRDYARSRVIESNAIRSPGAYDAALAKSLTIQAHLWPTAVGSLKGHTPTVTDALLLQAINEVIDAHARRVAATRDQLPWIVLLMVVIVALVSVGLTGYAGGVAKQRKGWRTTTISLTISAVMVIILDLDQPRAGLIQVSQQVLTETLEGMAPPPATAPTPSRPHDGGD